MTPKILIIGAGELGLSLIRSLTSHPAHPSVSVLLRASSSTDLSTYPIKVVHGDISSTAEELTPLLEGYDIVISATGFAGGPNSQLNLAHAVLEAGVPHYFPWQFGVDYDLIGRGSSQPLFDEQLDVRDLLRSQDKTKWTIVSTGLFTSFLFHPSFGVVDLDSSTGKATVNALGGWSNGITVTSAEDIGRITSKIVLDNPDIPQGVVYIASDTIKFEDVSKEVERVGWKVDRKIITVEELEVRRKRDPEDVGPKYALIWARNIGVSWDVGVTWNGKRGIEVESLREWVDRNLPRP
ncbi:hypothetical protein I302_107985 [Kwoniella bestiolae CBS 10118]|uniref:NmrA-like domain-containing protein n=1 Tax=Kwoniella bestiolae CBS 10118 TaxID=1296100 RepID=A0A1B9FWZ2_9TREE|nr:hypothetical protein I302_07650 [Kwoniella bestiolae CBS 10118]OCF23296.1 hypothetical protein I302_07650 [Kwoniella bestiolae CBS 10118]